MEVDTPDSDKELELEAGSDSAMSKLPDLGLIEVLSGADETKKHLGIYLGAFLHVIKAIDK